MNRIAIDMADVVLSVHCCDKLAALDFFMRCPFGFYLYSVSLSVVYLLWLLATFM
jgi:hypothetical protein